MLYKRENWRNMCCGFFINGNIVTVELRQLGWGLGFLSVSLPVFSGT